ncbi:SelB C-terminal domain-containing protein [uncultured Jatrophihabitans sp.]|uniref:selenocysteine-specific translation elongation factor n=1 Tax=uncultured Jatrophihabitans sp. TaxID=1610747 RepID=UPI0035CC98FF
MHVLATAGHVDHGKSTLVRALTGMEPDRFAEERRRGMTIDLGYAWTRLPSGEQLAFVDVPGHQRFIANMLAGLGPAPAVLFVVAADEGWSRQSAEHLAAIDALRVQRAVLAVTRSDLADPGPALADARAQLAASSLGVVEAVAVSGATGAGLDVLRAALDRLVASFPAPDDQAPIRLWLDRSFTIRGAGTVITGTLAAGCVAVGDELTVLTADGTRTATVRGLQSTGAGHASLGAVARVAVNLRGVPDADVGRGDLLLTPGAWHLTDTFDADLESRVTAALPGELVLHVGTAAVPVRLRPLGGRAVRLSTSRPLPLRAGDRAVLRDPGRQSVAAGVLVLDPDPPALGRRGAAAARAATLADGRPRLDAAEEVARRGLVRRDHLRRLGLDVDALPGEGEWLVDPPCWAAWAEQARRAAAEHAAIEPLEPGLPLPALRRALGLPDAGQVLGHVVREAGLVMDGGRVTLPSAERSLGRAERAVHELEQRLRADPFAAPEREELSRLGMGPRELAAAARLGRLYRVSPEIVLLPAAIPLAVERLRALPQPFTTSSARQALGSTRRVVVPLLEHLDDLGRTERVGAGSRRVR